MKPARLLSEAERDIRRAVNRYEERRRGLGERFLDELTRTFEQIAENPLIGIRDGGLLQFKRVRKFPYLVVFAEVENEIVFLAVHHHARDNAYWYDRLLTDFGSGDIVPQ
ncbi:type II toxin-antitoxin system RelE/ParE family toxin [Planctomyces sp. SH-PL14]|jgi:plasmid stabilization system protein ParE|uniref:type II toxin-antitoxin system RelE/ParE family toxin n=1 Tax=Planctomyces sp. SH-PL14 TaxID=1632864 RepID=UPI00078BE151|nr:type II toxin-antitoxin system RelE/ParE family toxin [Planctomyces sp. SH-PL14]AMV17696.1 Plasmid stabilization system protein [Planctomyces sp. SH-PL14]